MNHAQKHVNPTVRTSIPLMKKGTVAVDFSFELALFDCWALSPPMPLPPVFQRRLATPRRSLFRAGQALYGPGSRRQQRLAILGS